MADGSGGIEEIFYVEDRFRKIAYQFNMTTGRELCDGFEECLTDAAEDEWENIVAGLIAGQRNQANRFSNTVTRYYLKYVEDDERDVGLQYLDIIINKVKAEKENHANMHSTM